MDDIIKKANNIRVQEEGVEVSIRRILNFIGAAVTAADNAANNRTDITITASTAAGGTPSGTVIAETTIAGSAKATGTSAHFSRGDHTHGTPQITDYLENPPTNGEAAKAPTSDWAFDHNAANTGVHGAGTAALATTTNIATHSAATAGVHGIAAGSAIATTADIATHSAATAGIHGIAAGSAIATTADIATHSAATAGVHGIAAGSAFASSADIATHAAATAGIHGIAAGSAIATTAEIATHAALTASVHGIAAGSAIATTAEIATHAALTSVHSLSDRLQKQMIENDPLWLDATLSGTGTYCGICETATAGSVLAFGDVCYLLAASARWHPALANTATTSYGKLGVCVVAATGAAQTTSMLLWGKVSATTYPSLPVGGPVFLSAGTGGYVTGTVSFGTSDYVARIVGYGNAAAELYFKPDNTYIEKA